MVTACKSFSHHCYSLAYVCWFIRSNINCNWVPCQSESHSSTGPTSIWSWWGSVIILRSLSFNWTAIAALLGVSRMTVYRWRRELCLFHDRMVVPDDMQLRELVVEIHEQSPDVGETVMQGQLRSMGYRVIRQRMHNAIRSTDPLNVALRTPRGAIERRPYSVAGPNSLWQFSKWYVGLGLIITQWPIMDFTVMIIDMNWFPALIIWVIPDVFSFHALTQWTSYICIYGSDGYSFDVHNL